MSDEAPVPASLIDQVGIRADRATQRLSRTWHQYERTPGAMTVSLDRLVRAWDSVDRLRLLIVGARGEMGLLAKLTEEIGPRVPRTAQGAQAFVEGVGRVIRHGKADKTVWDTDGLIPAVGVKLGARIADDPAVLLADPEAGEAHPPSEIARRAAAEAVAWMAAACGVTPSKGMSTTPLKALGLNPDDYRKRDWGGFTIEVERGVIDGAPEEHDERE